MSRNNMLYMARGIKLVCMESGWYVDLRGRIGEFNNCVMFFYLQLFSHVQSLSLGVHLLSSNPQWCWLGQPTHLEDWSKLESLAWHGLLGTSLGPDESWLLLWPNNTCFHHRTVLFRKFFIFFRSLYKNNNYSYEMGSHTKTYFRKMLKCGTLNATENNSCWVCLEKRLKPYFSKIWICFC
jgi:hypothetical protein